MEKRKNPYGKNITKHCSVCNKAVMVDQYGNGQCKNCGWFQSESAEHNVTKVVPDNLVSFARAKQLVKEGKPIKPTLAEFIEGYEQHGEMQFWHKGRHYGLISLTGEVQFYEWNVKGSVQSFATIEEFATKAHIGGRLLKDIWHEIEKVDYI
jgi:hypothetical protein